MSRMDWPKLAAWIGLLVASVAFWFGVVALLAWLT
jgi:hypothetical protein